MITDGHPGLEGDHVSKKQKSAIAGAIIAALTAIAAAFGWIDPANSGPCVSVNLTAGWDPVTGLPVCWQIERHDLHG